MVRLSGYLNLLFEEGSFPERVDRVAEAGLEGIEAYGFDLDHEAIAERAAEHDLEWVYLSGGRPDFTDSDNHEAAIESIEDSLALAAEHGIHNLNVKSGDTQEGLDAEAQRESVVAVLEDAAPLTEEAGVRLVLEPLNTRVDHPGHFTTTAAEGAEIVRAVDSPNVRLLFDFYHEQITHGDVIRSFREHVDVVGHVHVADNPGRHQPGTGEINYGNVLDAVAESEYEGFVGCEFTPAVGSDPVAVMREVADLV
ncbi:MAG: TIM barrel protein [Halobacteriales archaeon]